MRVETMFDEDYAFVAARISALEEEVVFDHLQHVQADIACNACHTGVDQSQDISDYVEVNMAACMDCHATDQVENECITCHDEITVDWAPENHHHGWERRHGLMSRHGDRRPNNDCALCHQESSCVQCHLETPPKNHNANFRLRGHGIISRADRQNCAACHESTSCDRCHAEVLPRNHTALFGGAKSTHCITCHFPLETSGCSTCHAATPSHSLGPVQPAWHTPDMNCRSCHGTTLPLSHVDNGSNCNLCHP